MKRKALIFIVLAVALVAVGAAYAAWTASHNNSPGKGRAGSLTAPTIVLASDAEVSGISGFEQAFPGTNGDVALKVTNPNPNPIHLATVNLGSATIRNSDEANCPPGSASIVMPSNVGSAATSVNASETKLVVLEGALALAAGAPDGCQGETFWFDYQSTIWAAGNGGS